MALVILWWCRLASEEDLCKRLCVLNMSVPSRLSMDCVSCSIEIKNITVLNLVAESRPDSVSSNGFP